MLLDIECLVVHLISINLITQIYLTYCEKIPSDYEIARYLWDGSFNRLFLHGSK